MAKSRHTSKRLATGILIAGLMVLGNGLIRGGHSIQNYFELKENLKTMTLTVEGLREQNSGLRKEIHKLKTSPDYARKVLRDKYHVTEPGERIIFFSE